MRPLAFQWIFPLNTRSLWLAIDLSFLFHPLPSRSAALCNAAHPCHGQAAVLLQLRRLQILVQKELRLRACPGTLLVWCPWSGGTSSMEVGHLNQMHPSHHGWIHFADLPCVFGWHVLHCTQQCYFVPKGFHSPALLSRLNSGDKLCIARACFKSRAQPLLCNAGGSKSVPGPSRSTEARFGAFMPDAPLFDMQVRQQRECSLS